MKLLVSRCLLGEPCRYDGRVKTDLRAPLRAAGIGDDCWISVCPESDGGLPTPRTPSEIRGTARGVLEGRDHIMAADGRDNTACFMKGARIAADLCRENGVRLALLKAKSPSCGFGQVYDGTFTGTLVAAAASPPNYFRMQTYAFSPRTTSIFLPLSRRKKIPLAKIE